MDDNTWIKVTDPPELVDNVKRLILPSDYPSDQKKDFTVLETLDGKYYFSGKFGDSIYTKYTPLETVLKENITPLTEMEKDFSMRNTITRAMFNNQTYPLFSFKLKNNFYAFELNLIGQSDTLKVLMNGNSQFTSIYTDYAVNPKHNIELCVSKPNADNICVCYIKFSNDDFFSVSNFYEYVKIIVDNIHSDSFALYDDTSTPVEYSTEEPISAKTYILSSKGYFGSTTDSKSAIAIPHNAIDPFYFILVSVDIANTKIYIDGNKTFLETENNKVIPYEDENFKGPQFLYPIFYNLGIPFNQFIKFEGSIIVDGTLYPINYVKISEPIRDTTTYGVIQFLLDKETKLDNTPDTNDNGTGNIFGITFYPIVTDENFNYSYTVLNDIKNSVVSQNSIEKLLFTIDGPVDETFINECVYHTDKYFILVSGNKIYVYNIENNKLKVIKFGDPSYNIPLNLIKDFDENNIIIMGNEDHFYYTIYDKELLFPIGDAEVNELDDIKSGFTTSVIPKDFDTIDGGFELKFDNDDNYYRIKTVENNKVGLYIYKDHSSIGERNDIANINITPSTIQSLDGVLIFPKSDVRTADFPKGFSL